MEDWLENSSRRLIDFDGLGEICLGVFMETIYRLWSVNCDTQKPKCY